MNMESSGAVLNVTDTGGTADTALVFQHFWGGSSQTWNEVIFRLRDRFRCVALDARGAGSSTAPVTGYSTEDHADDAANVIAALGLNRYVLVGHSMGGKSSQLLAARRPAGLVGLVLVASSPPSPMAIDEMQREQMRSAYQDRNAVVRTLDHVLQGTPIVPALRTQLIIDALRLSPEATAGWLDIGSREDFSERVSNVDVPVVIMAGELDRVDPVPVVRTHIVPHYPSAAVHFIPEKGHLLPVEAPDDVAALIRSLSLR